MKNLRGINQTLIDEFKKSPLYEMDKDVLACIRDNAIGLYYRCDRIAMVKLGRDGKLKCEIHGYYIGEGNDYKKLTPEEIVRQFETIKKNSRGKKHDTEEKEAQQMLVSQNNGNPKSKWFCFDIEYRQAEKAQRRVKDIKEEDFFDGRFDILAISKEEPHRIAVIELKYGSGAVGGSSGIVKHLADFKKFNDSERCKENLRTEAQTIIKNLRELEIGNVPEALCKDDLTPGGIEFYVICLYDKEHNSPKETVNHYRKECKEAAVCHDGNFFYKQVASPAEIEITDILDKEQYD